MLRRVCIVALATCGIALGQATAKAGTKAPAFDVVSIKPSGTGIGGFGTNPSGYFAKGLPLYTTVMMAYFPVERMMGYSASPILSPPPLLSKDAYDIEAKFDPATAEAWKHMTTAQQGETIRPMLQAVLAERCKLAVHKTMVDAPVYELVVAKHGPKLKETAPGEAPPEHAIPIPGDAMMVPMSNPKMKTTTTQVRAYVTFFKTSMPAFAIHLSKGMDRQVVDRTGLTGRYDFVLPKPVWQSPAQQVEGEASDPASGPAWLYDVTRLGLELRRAKAPQPMLVIDHIEKPTSN